MPLLRYGHAPGHVRDTACQAFEAWLGWTTGPEPTVEYEVNYVPRQISISEACKLVWNCTDIVSGMFADPLIFEGLDIKTRTYAGCARAIVADIKTRRNKAA
jgi:hypothetical protein